MAPTAHDKSGWENSLAAGSSKDGMATGLVSSTSVTCKIRRGLHGVIRPPIPPPSAGMFDSWIPAWPAVATDGRARPEPRRPGSHPGSEFHCRKPPPDWLGGPPLAAVGRHSNTPLVELIVAPRGGSGAEPEALRWNVRVAGAVGHRQRNADGSGLVDTGARIGGRLLATTEAAL